MIASALGGYTGRCGPSGSASTAMKFCSAIRAWLSPWAFATVLVAGLFASTAASVVGTGVQAHRPSHRAQHRSGAAGSLAARWIRWLTSLTGCSVQNGSADATEAAAPRRLPPPPHLIPPLRQLRLQARQPAPGTGRAEFACRPAAPTATPAVAPAAGGDVGTLTPELRDEVGRLLTRNLAAADFDEGDRTYLIDVVARVSGVDTDAAAARVDEMVAMASAAAQQATEAADATRQAGAAASIAFFLSLLVGAFVACVAAVLGGRERDEVRLVATA